MAGLLQRLQQQNFGPNDSVIASGLMHPQDGLLKIGKWFQDNVNTAAGIPNISNQDEASIYAYGPSDEQKVEAANNLAGAMQTGAMPFAPESSGGLLGTFSIPKKNITVKDPIRVAYPGIYDRPDEIARRAADNVAPEDPAMKSLFGVDRNQLYDIRQTRTAGNEAPDIKMAKNPKGSALAPSIMTPKNTQRIIDVLGEAEKYPGLQKGMDSWYEMGPLYDRLTQISDDPVRDFKRFQTFTGMASPGSDVLTEINRGTAALMKSNQGRFEDFVKYGGTTGEDRGAKYPKEMLGVMGHPYHSTAQAKPMQMYEDSGIIQMKSPKVPLYIQSAGVPETGFQMDLPVGDAHWSRGVGLADVRNNKSYAASITMPELASLGPWWNDKIAKPLGTNAVNAQARAWGTFAPATGVDTPVGAPKLELISQKIMDAAKAYGISPEEARDKLLLGQIYAPNIGLLNGLGK